MTFSFSQPRWPTRTSLGVVGPKVSIRRRHTAKRKSMFFRGSIVLTFTKYGAVACGGWSLLLSKNHSVTPKCPFTKFLNSSESFVIQGRRL